MALTTTAQMKRLVAIGRRTNGEAMVRLRGRRNLRFHIALSRLDPDRYPDLLKEILFGIVMVGFVGLALYVAWILGS